MRLVVVIDIYSLGCSTIAFGAVAPVVGLSLMGLFRSGISVTGKFNGVHFCAVVHLLRSWVGLQMKQKFNWLQSLSNEAFSSKRLVGSVWPAGVYGSR